MNFHNVRLPYFIEVFCVGGPTFSTSCATTKSGREVRREDYTFPKYKYKLKNCILSEKEFYQFNSFFIARSGQRFSFKMKDHADYKVQQQAVFKSDGFTKEFMLYKLYEDQELSFLRPITKPIEGSLRLFCENKIIVPANVDFATGKVTLEEILPNNTIIVAEFEFCVEVRFNSDSFDYQILQDGSFELLDVEMVEVCHCER